MSDSTGSESEVISRVPDGGAAGPSLRYMGTALIQGISLEHLYEGSLLKSSGAPFMRGGVEDGYRRRQDS